MTKSLSISLLFAALAVGLAAPRQAIAQSSFELLSAEMQAKVDGTFGDGTWNATAFTRALATKAQIATTVESVVNGQKLAVSVDLPGQSVPVPGVTLRTPKLNDDNCQANLPNCPDCDWWNAPCHVAKVACEVGKGAAQTACQLLNIAKAAISEKKIADVEFPDAHAEAHVQLSDIVVRVSPAIDSVTVAGHLDGDAHVQGRVSLQPEPLVVLAGCFKTDMYLHNTRVTPVERDLAVSSGITLDTSGEALRVAYSIPEMKVKIRVDQMVYPKLLKDNIHAVFTCPQLVNPTLLLIGALTGDLFTYDHKVKIQATSGSTDALAYKFEFLKQERHARVIGGPLWVGIELTQ